MNSTRGEVLSSALAEAQIDAKDNMRQTLVRACLGSPWCFLSGGEAEDELEKGCLVCDEYLVDPDGSWVLRKAAGVSYGEN